MQVLCGQVDLTTDSAAISSCDKRKRRQHAPGLLEWMHAQRGQADLTTYGTTNRACEKGR